MGDVYGIRLHDYSFNAVLVQINYFIVGLPRDYSMVSAQINKHEG